jgi:hypothetical protein
MFAITGITGNAATTRLPGVTPTRRSITTRHGLPVGALLTVTLGLGDTAELHL